MTTTTGTLILSLVIKPALLVAVAYIASIFLRRRSAAARHIVWANSIVMTLALPVIAFMLPPLRIARASQPAFAIPAETHAPKSRGVSSLQTQGVARLPDAAPGVSSRNAVAAADVSVGVLISGWIMVALCLVIRRVGAEWVAQGVVRRGVRPSARVRQLCTRHWHDDGNFPRIVLSGETASPVVIGAFRPVIVLPLAAQEWAQPEFDSVMIHELGHVNRRDCLLNLCADMATALYWCNPLVWFAARRMKSESEHACDDLVLRGGIVADAYAGLLLQFATWQRSVRALPRAATAMARASELERRLMWLFNDTASRTPIRRTVGLGYTGIALLAALPASALTLRAAPTGRALQAPQAGRAVGTAQVAGTAQATQTAGTAQATRTAGTSQATQTAGTTQTRQTAPPSQLNTTVPGPEPDQAGDSLLSPLSERLPITWSRTQTANGAAAALAGRDASLAERLAMAAGRQPMHGGDLVSERAAWALAQSHDARLVEPLIDSLASADWRVQAYAAWALATARDARAIPPLVSLVRHPNWRLRAMAAYALHESRNEGAEVAMRGALNDDAWQVRLEAVEYFADVGHPSLKLLLQPYLQDRHVAVRNAARAALNH